MVGDAFGVEGGLFKLILTAAVVNESVGQTQPDYSAGVEGEFLGGFQHR